MKLLLDQNLLPKFVVQLADLFPNSTHVQMVGLDTADDTELWNYARDNGYFIVSKDVDFSDRITIHGMPPKVIWLRRGNCSTTTVERILRSHHSNIESFADDLNRGILVLL